MKLELFKFIDDTLILLDEYKDELDEAAEELDNFFREIFQNKDYFLDTKCRVKGRDSLREKILRKNLYIEHEEPGNVLLNLSDLIGLRIECRFIEDELKIYNNILKLFTNKVDDNFYYSDINKNIMLNLSDIQPEIQKNGFEIYKIDGTYLMGELKINFELQIKSMVNVFWSEIDHRILYKNYNYVLTEDFYRDIMASIKDNLSMIDRQLMVVFDHLNDLDSKEVKNEKTQFKEMLSKIIHDVYIGKVRDELGFVISFKRSTDVIVDYLFMKEYEENSKKYSQNFIRVLNRIIEISGTEVRFDEYIEFEREIFYNDDFTRKVGNAFVDIMNKDFRWNLFFKVIFEIEEGNRSEDFEGFLVYLRYLFRVNIKNCLNDKEIEEQEKDKIINSILSRIASNFIKDMDIDFISEKNVKELNRYVEILLYDINNYEDWIDNKDYICDKIETYEC